MKSKVIYGFPGVGKTTYLLKVCKQYAEAGARVCFVSHTKAAAAEIVSRLDSKYGKQVAASTIHSLVYGLVGISRSQVVTRNMLVDFGNTIGVTISGDFDITGEQERVIEAGDEAMSIISRADARMVDHMQEYHESEMPLPERSFKYISESYKAWKKEYGYIDFNDMLRAYNSAPIPLDYDILIVDEAQDLSALQWKVIDGLVKKVKWCVVAGDPDQALFVWGGAQTSGMADFIDKYNADTHLLTQSYRIPRAVHRTAMAVRNNISDKKDDHTYLPRDAEGESRVHMSPASIQFDDRDTLILYRTHALRRELENELIDTLTPYTTLNGLADPWGGQWGAAIHGYTLYKEDKPMTKRQERALGKHSRYNGTIPKNLHWTQVLDISPRYMNYLQATEGKMPNVKLSTIHGAKGMEAERVILYTGMTERVFDGMARNPDAEHRVFYVGVTRAKHTLDVVHGALGYAQL